MGTIRRVYSRELKLEVARALVTGEKRFSQVCRENNVCESLVRRWAWAGRLASLGLSVPGDVALTWFDDIAPALPDGTGLTTVAQPYEEIGMAAVELLMRRIQDRRSARKSVELRARQAVRGSSTG